MEIEREAPHVSEEVDSSHINIRTFNVYSQHFTECRNTGGRANRVPRRGGQTHSKSGRLVHFLSVIDSSSKQKIIRTVELNSTINQLDLIDIYRPLHPTAAKDTFFWSSHGTLTKIDILGHKTHLNKFETI